MYGFTASTVNSTACSPLTSAQMLLAISLQKFMNRTAESNDFVIFNMLLFVPDFIHFRWKPRMQLFRSIPDFICTCPPYYNKLVQWSYL